MIRLCWILLCLSFALGLLPPGEHNVSYNGIPFYLFVPENPNGRLIITLHGTGEIPLAYIRAWQPEVSQRGYFVMAPYPLKKQGWTLKDNQRIKKVLYMLKREYPIEKVIIHGGSSGGHYALYLGISFPTQFQAVVTFMGLATVPVGHEIKFQKDPALKVPILLIHGRKDPVIPIQYARANAQFLRSKDYDVTYWEEADMKHEFYRPVKSDILDWIDEQFTTTPAP